MGEYKSIAVGVEEGHFIAKQETFGLNLRLIVVRGTRHGPHVSYCTSVCFRPMKTTIRIQACGTMVMSHMYLVTKNNVHHPT
jgi:hypothetical protein